MHVLQQLGVSLYGEEAESSSCVYLCAVRGQTFRRVFIQNKNGGKDAEPRCQNCLLFACSHDPFIVPQQLNTQNSLGFKIMF